MSYTQLPPDFSPPVPISEGGTGASSAAAGFNNLNPMTTKGDVIYEVSANTAARLAIGSTGEVLTVSAGGLPVWAAGGGGGSAITALTGDGTATGPGSAALTLATVNSNVGSFGSSTSIPSLTVNAKGLVTAASGNAVVAPAGTLSGATLAAGVTASSLTSVGTIATGVWNGTTIAVANGGTGQTSATAAFNSLNPMTTTGDIIYESGANTSARLAIGSTGTILQVVGGIPAWTAPAATTQVLYNQAGLITGKANMTFNQTSNTLSVNNVIVASTLTAGTLSISAIRNVNGPAIDVLHFQLTNSGGAATLDWVNGTAGFANFSSPVATLDWMNQLLYDSGGTTSLDWENRGLNGNWTISNTFSSYNGDSTQGNGLASIVKSVALAAQTTSLGPTTLFTPAAAGMYEVAVYQVTTTAGSAGTLDTTIGWNDGVARTSSPAAQILLSTTAYSAGSQVIYAASGQAITYTTTVAAAVGSPQYRLLIIVKRLS